MGIGGVRPGEEDSSSGSDGSYPYYSEPHFDPAVENRKKTVLSDSSMAGLAQMLAERERAADEAMKQLLGGCSPPSFSFQMHFAVSNLISP